MKSLQISDEVYVAFRDFCRNPDQRRYMREAADEAIIRYLEEENEAS